MDELASVETSSASGAGGVISWDGATLALKHEGKTTITAPEEGGAVYDLLAGENISLSRIYWPIEQLLVRPFSLPLADTRMLDADILSQEVAELTGEEEDNWWLAWRAGKLDSGVAGLVFGLSQNIRREMQQHPEWEQCPQLLIDGWERLKEACGGCDNCAVIDEDADGVFFGFVRNGVWHGLRRINRKFNSDEMQSDESVARDILYSWKAMGMDVENDPVVGKLGPSLASRMQESFANWDVALREKLLERHAANFEIGEQPAPALNFRHGKWAVRKSWHGFQRWKRPAIMAAGLLLIWMVATTVQIFTIGMRAEKYQGMIEEAFHRGLPKEAVMLDPLAQLRRASGGSEAGGNGSDLLQQLKLLGEAYRQQDWQLKEISYENGKMVMSGSASDIASLNRIRDRLGKASQREVVISDTDLTAGRVSFRMKW